MISKMYNKNDCMIKLNNCKINYFTIFCLYNQSICSIIHTHFEIYSKIWKLTVYEFFILINELFAFDKWIFLFENLFEIVFAFFEIVFVFAKFSSKIFRFSFSVKVRFCHTKKTFSLRTLNHFSNSCYCAK